MKRRLDRLIVVREAARRVASATYNELSARVAQQTELAARIEDAAERLSPETGLAWGGAIGARLELAGRMHLARCSARSQADAARMDCHEAAVARQSAGRALDTVRAMSRAEKRAKAALRDEQADSVRTKPVS
jgi:hypothetical protein